MSSAMSSDYEPSEQDMDLIDSDDEYIDITSVSPAPPRHNQPNSSRIRSPPPQLPPTPPLRSIRAPMNLALPLPASSSSSSSEGRRRSPGREEVPRPDFANLPAPAARTRNRTDLPPLVVDLAGDSSEDEDDVVFVRSSNLNSERLGPLGSRLRDATRNGEVAARETLERRTRTRDIDQEMNHFCLSISIVDSNIVFVTPGIEAVLQRHGAETEALLREDPDNNDRQRDIFSPPVPPPRPPRRIGFGGAVFRSGNRQINFAPLPDGRARERLQLTRERRERRDDNADRPPVEVPAGHRNFAWLGGGIGAVTRDILANFGFGPDADGNVGGPMEPRDPQGWAAVLRTLGVVREAGRAGAGEVNVEAEIAKVPLPDYAAPPPGYTTNFEITSPPSPIEIDDSGRVVPTKRKRAKPYLACIQCLDPLLVSSAYRTSDERVWALQCGHMIDQKCLHALSTPTTSEQLATIINNEPPAALPILDGRERRGRNKRQKLTKPPKPAEYTWRCPACNEEHLSMKEADKEEWEQMDGRGALQVYA
ncbi:hypothetical protein BCR39DRAFT_512400 [Naematelia encephala]|uniref:Uncharacterized protein n=1 Tax=Naematelia encephala TaxID=71784 RepID=A0A1Y2BMB0_9TREE|nr:hypothetical protein BCR39DRAFT_512400 [Naematelia encephala]